MSLRVFVWNETLARQILNQYNTPVHDTLEFHLWLKLSPTHLDFFAISKKLCSKGKTLC